MNAHFVPFNANLDAALFLASLGFAVFPCRQNKTPYGKWRDQSTTDEATIRNWWMQWPDAIPGVDCGKSGLLVFDLDRHGGPDGVANFARLLDQNGVAHDGGVPFGVPAVRTPSGGLHLYCRQPTGETFGNSEGQLSGLSINVRGVGGYVIGQAVLADGRRYEPLPGAGRFSVPPEWLLAMLRKPQTAPAKPAGVPSPQIAFAPAGPAAPSLRPTRLTDHERAYAARALRDNATELAGLQHGDGRNARCNSIAYRMGRMVGAGWIGSADVEAALFDAMSTNGYRTEKVEGDAKAIKTIRSGLNSGRNYPLPSLPVLAMPAIDGAQEIAARFGRAQ